jgi:hypothetical protein
VHAYEPVGQIVVGGFVYQAPGPGWQGVIYAPTERGSIFHHYKRDGDRLQFQVDTFSPTQPVRNQSELLSWVAKAGGGDALFDLGRGATCARYSHRWNQTISLGDQPTPWATIEEFGIVCIDPTAPTRLIQARIFERLPPGAPASDGFKEIAERLLSGVHARPPSSKSVE